jgi:two-component sensor histidine kinase/CheY-like chemotaxis protein
MKPLSILYLEDNDIDVDLIESRLDAEKIPHKMNHVKTVQQFDQALQKQAFDIILLDYVVPGFAELSALKKSKAALPDTPVIIISGTIGEEIAIETLKQGATDYVLKHRISRLVPAIHRALQEAEEHLKRREAEEKIQRNLREKEILLREIHHRVKNNLQVMYSLLNIQSRNIHHDPSRRACEDCRNRIYTMSLVHEQMFIAENISGIHFRESIEILIGKLFKAQSVAMGVSFRLEIDDVFLPIHISIPLALAVNELITNALNYAFPDGRKGEIRIGLHPAKGKSYEFFVQDDGVGLPGSIRVEKTKTVGLHLIHLLTQQIEGSVSVRRRKGTAFRIVFPFEQSE